MLLLVMVGESGACRKGWRSCPSYLWKSFGYASADNVRSLVMTVWASVQVPVSKNVGPW